MIGTIHLVPIGTTEDIMTEVITMSDVNMMTVDQLIAGPIIKKGGTTIYVLNRIGNFSITIAIGTKKMLGNRFPRMGSG